MKKHLLLAFVYLTCLGLAAGGLWFCFCRPPSVTREQYEHERLRAGMTLREVEEVIGFPGEDAKVACTWTAGFARMAQPNHLNYRWKCWRGRDSEIRVGFDANDTLRWKVWSKDLSPSDEPRVAQVEVAYGVDGRQIFGTDVELPKNPLLDDMLLDDIQGNNFYDRWLAKIRVWVGW